MGLLLTVLFCCEEKFIGTYLLLTLKEIESDDGCKSAFDMHLCHNVINHPMHISLPHLTPSDIYPPLNVCTDSNIYRWAAS